MGDHLDEQEDGDGLEADAGDDEAVVEHCLLAAPREHVHGEGRGDAANTRHHLKTLEVTSVWKNLININPRMTYILLENDQI